MLAPVMNFTEKIIKLHHMWMMFHWQKRENSRTPNGRYVNPQRQPPRRSWRRSLIRPLNGRHWHRRHYADGRLTETASTDGITLKAA